MTGPRSSDVINAIKVVTEALKIEGEELDSLTHVRLRNYIEKKWEEEKFELIKVCEASPDQSHIIWPNGEELVIPRVSRRKTSLYKERAKYMQRKEAEANVATIEDVIANFLS